MRKKSTKGTKEAQPFAERLKKFVHSKRFAKLRGACYMFFAIFAAVGIFSFLAHGGSEEGNVFGILGHWVAKIFTNKLFGIASLGLTLLIFLYGLRLWNVRTRRWWHFVGIVFFWMIWVSCLLGYIGGHIIQTTNFENYAGIGLVLAGIMDHLIHWATPVVLIFVAAVFLVFVHKVNIPLPDLSSLTHRDHDPDEEDDDATDDGKRQGFLARLVSRLKEFRHADNDEEEEEVEEEVDEEDSEETPIPPRDDDDPFVSPTPTTGSKPDEVPFSIDDEFARVNQQAQAAATGQAGPAFTITENTSDDFPSAPDSDTTPANDTPTPVATGDYARHFSPDDLYDPKLDLHSFNMPPCDLLEMWESKNVKVTNEELYANKDRIVSTLKNYGIDIVEISATPGPTVTLYEIKPAAGVRISRIKSLEDDIALSLAALGIRIIAPIPGRGTIGIEVPNAKPQIVSMRSMLESPSYSNSKAELPIALGRTISGEAFVTDLAKMPHLLMAGATGTGKSVGLNAVIASLRYKKHPAEIKFVMVDPKKVELSLYEKIERHYLAKLPDSDEAIITDFRKVVRTLNSLCIEMDQRYDLLKNAGVRKITEYNDKFIHRHLNPEKGHRFLPYIIVVIDEFADLIMTAGKEVESPICRLAQLARAVGIHLIIATQRPTTNIITGTIKANFPARIAFKVTSIIDSRTILDTSGAQRLIGRGDMLISLSGSDMVRLQCALIETEEIEKLASFIGEQHGYPDGFLLPEYIDETDEPNKDFDPKQKDEYFDEAARLVVSMKLGSTSLLQRKLGLGYARSGRIMDQLEAAGIVGPTNGSKPREVLIHDEMTLEEILNNL